MPIRPEPRSDRSAERRLLTAMALAIIAMMGVLGIIYLALWAGAADDLSRLLPASTRAYAAAPAPWSMMTRVIAMPIWRDPETLQSQVLRDGYLASERSGEMAGLPLDTVRELMRGMDSFELAIVPTAEGDALLVFVEMRDATQRKRVSQRLAPLLETVDRRVGFRVDKVRRRPWQILVGADVEPPRVVDMEPWFILSWGSPTGLDDLLEARVEGRVDALSRREGFAWDAANAATLGVKGAQPPTPPGFRLAVDASSAWRLFAKADEPPPGGLFEYLDLLTIEAAADTHDILSVRAEITDRDLAAMLVRGLRKAPHELPARAPSDALFVLSATGDDLSALTEVMRGLAFRLQRDFEPSADASSAVANLIAAAADLPAGGGEIALIGLPIEDGGPGAFSPLFLVRTLGATPGMSPPGVLQTVDDLAAHLAERLPRRFGDGYAHGEVLHQGMTLHLEVAHSEEGTTGPPDIRLAWRTRAGVLEIAPDVATLDRFASTSETLARTPRLAQSRRGLPTEAAIAFIADRRLLDRPDAPLLELLSHRLRDDFNFGVTLDAIDDHLQMHSNLGLWTLATAVASGSKAEIDTFALPGLEPRCREAYDAFCTLYPDAVPCRPFALGRLSRIQAVCAELFAHRLTP